MSTLADTETRLAEIERRLRALECGLMHFANEQALEGDKKTVSGFTYQVMDLQDQVRAMKGSLDDHRTDLEKNWTRLKQSERDA